MQEEEECCKECGEILREDTVCGWYENNCPLCAYCCDGHCNSCLRRGTGFSGSYGCLDVCALCNEDTHFDYDLCIWGGYCCRTCMTIYCGPCSRGPGNGYRRADDRCWGCKTKREERLKRKKIRKGRPAGRRAKRSELEFVSAYN